MSTYVLMTRLGPEVMSDPRGRKVVGKEWKKRVDSLCPQVRWLQHYALLGPFDFMDIYQAPNDEVAHMVSLISRTCGAITAESWPAIEYDRFLEVVRPIEETLKD